jgi:hypothetical protein
MIVDGKQAKELSVSFRIEMYKKSKVKEIKEEIKNYSFPRAKCILSLLYFCGIDELLSDDHCRWKE